jgi:tetratricopeptide (TPR) repeat protein
MNIKDMQSALLCCRFLGEFDKSHYNHFVWLGRIHREMGNYEEAVESFKEALKICEKDSKWPSDSMKSIIEAIHKEIEITYKLQSRKSM